MSIIEFDVLTGELLTREYTKEELAQRELDAQAAEARLAEQAEQAAKKQELLDRLGITEEEAKLLLS